MLIKKLNIVLLIIGGIILSGCSTKQIVIKKEPNCNIASNATFVIKPYYDKSFSKIGASNLPNGDIIRIISYTRESLKKYFPNNFIVLNNSYNYPPIYYVLIRGAYKTYTYNSTEPVTVFHSPQYFSGYSNSGTYYFGSTGASSSTIWMPTKETGINILVMIDIFDDNSNNLLHCQMLTHNISDLESKDWIDKCIEKLTSCSREKNYSINEFNTKKNISSSIDLEYIQDECKRDNVKACIDLANIYEKGKETNKNKKKALFYYKKACKLGDENSCKKLNIK